VGHLLSRPPEEAARLVALTLLARAEEAARRLADPADAEALHDFRVALRRLRSVLRAYRGPLAGALKKRHRRGLRDLARGTGEGRDAEVALAWVAAQRDRLEEGQQAGLDWFAAQLEKRKGAGYDEAQRHLGEVFEPLAEELQKRLGVYTRRVRLDHGGGGEDSFGDLVAAEARRDLARLEELLAGLAAPDDSARGHRARIAVKRLRYLLEPLERELPSVQPIVRTLKQLQDVLGELNDAHVLEDELATAVEGAARHRALSLLDSAVAGGASAGAAGEGDDGGAGAPVSGWDPVDGLLALARLNRGRRDRLFAELAPVWIGEGETATERRALSRAVGELAGYLAAGFSPPPPEGAERAPAPVP
jgi:CHAD domain-containing protein